MGLSNLSADFDKYATMEHETHPFYHFEPWDVGKRPDWVIKQARKDGINLDNPEILKHIGTDPHPFQTGFMMSEAYTRCLLAGTQVGKSYCALINMIVTLTGEIPISLRYNAGVNSGVKRLINQNNIYRWGRREKGSTVVIDYDTKMMGKGDGTEWDCGEILGVGRFPVNMIAPPGSVIWLGTYMKAWINYWWPRLSEQSRSIIPEHLINRRAGNKGFEKINNIVHLARDTKIVGITFDSGFQRFEAEYVFQTCVDEEPTDERIVQAIRQHCKYMGLFMTPYNGMTYTRKMMFPEFPSEHLKVFHATQYDSPYQTKEMIEIRRKDMEVWDIGARIWGLHTETTGKPYYNRSTISSWLNKYTNFNYTKYRFMPKRESVNIDDLLNVEIKKEPCFDDKYAWRIFEDVKINQAYLLTADTSEGAEEVSEAGDMNCAYITRPVDDEDRKRDSSIKAEQKEIIVAMMRTYLPTEQFADECLYGARYFNNALLASETRRGFSNATFVSKAKFWPYWYKHVSINDASNRPKEHIGFDTNAATRNHVFDLIRERLNMYTEDEYPHIPDIILLTELMSAVVGKNGRCDHTTQGSLDNALAYGIALYIYKNAPDQITLNVDEVTQEKKETRRNRNTIPEKDNGPCGMKMLGYRRNK